MGLTVLNGGSERESENQMELTTHERNFLAEWRNVVREENEALYKKLKTSSESDEAEKGDIMNRTRLEEELKKRGLHIGHEKIARMVKTPGFPKCQVGKYKNPMFSLKAVTKWIQEQH
ncbi:hypothetical protein [Loigolactobacillus bifermentans]|jgi:hypothetical protein|uniref:Uncharacterized protein n=1 Tax=Loigolactobacillus bifermentans DSM 20003 TaxID=1423726 RepID=A0A0R1H3R8_9LACO|nr:hypothetical protein [Loigolactobacillus bifermentans]KRK40840.1 hypothetical protein FC07_GL002592 [Loigolactobacillus bifermentans DSM 20003]QGG59593.1 hypothetical protein LB003_03355 [Loigolactobacillus bifermentans]